MQPGRLPRNNNDKTRSIAGYGAENPCGQAFLRLDCRCEEAPEGNLRENARAGCDGLAPASVMGGDALNCQTPPHVAKDIMATRLVTLSPDTDVLEAIASLLKARVTGAPVLNQESAYAGVFSDKCAIRVLHAQMTGASSVKPKNPPLARSVMVSKLVTLRPDMDVFDAIALLLKSHVSGAPVVDENQQFVGIFSEKTSMNVLVTAAYHQLPNCHVEGFIDTDRNRAITEDTDLEAICQIFFDTHYRRLPVLRGNQLIGQVSRRDFLFAAQALYAPNRRGALSGWLLGANAKIPDASERVSAYMDTRAKTIHDDMDLLGIVQIFRDSNYRRLPVVHDQKLLGQVSRRDVLHAVHGMIASSPSRDTTLLYLSSLMNREDAPMQ
jgi:CBS domain-containing protein